MSVAFRIDPDLISQLQKHPDRKFFGTMDGSRFVVQVVIANYPQKIIARYKGELGGRTPAELGLQLGREFSFQHFGLILTFDHQTDIILNDDKKRLNTDLRSLVDAFGPVVLRNACLDTTAENLEQRNIFPHLRFHFDRSSLQESQISLFSRDPNDPEQRFPRKSSTLFVANIVAWLQNAREAATPEGKEPGMRASYDLFAEQNVRPLFGDVVFDQAWNEPEGTGELCIIDNRTVLHASFHGDLRGKGWRIGARYLV